MQEKNPRELRSKSTSRLKVKRGRSQPASHHEAAEQRRITRSMSAARDLGRNGEGEGASAEIQEKGRRNLIREERDSKSRWGSSWRQSEGRGVDTQQHEETAPERMRSISTGRIPLDGRRSISSSRVGIGARRVRSTSTARSVEASRRPLGESTMEKKDERQPGKEDHLQSRGLGVREQGKSKRRVTFCEQVIEHEPEPCDFSSDGMEEGEVDTSEEEKKEDTGTEFEGEDVTDQGVMQKEEDNNDGDVDMKDTDVEARSSSPPAVWSKKAQGPGQAVHLHQAEHHLGLDAKALRL